MESDDRKQAGLDHAWRYFQLHATQRMSVFNFFILFAGLLIAGLTSTIQGSPRFAVLGIGVGLLLVLLAFVFWKLDQRACFLIGQAEQALGQLEADSLTPPAQIVRSEPAVLAQSTERLWTHRKSFGLIFAVVAFVGLGGIALSSLRFFEIVEWNAAAAPESAQGSGAESRYGRLNIPQPRSIVALRPGEA